MKRLGLEEGISRLDLGLGTNDDSRKEENDKLLALGLGLGSETANPLAGSNSLNPEGHKEEGSYAGAGAYY